MTIVTCSSNITNFESLSLSLRSLFETRSAWHMIVNFPQVWSETNLFYHITDMKELSLNDCKVKCKTLILDGLHYFDETNRATCSLKLILFIHLFINLLSLQIIRSICWHKLLVTPANKLLAPREWIKSCNSLITCICILGRFLYKRYQKVVPNMLHFQT